MSAWQQEPKQIGIETGEMVINIGVIASLHTVEIKVLSACAV
jgi:hypothetical protein